MANIHLIGLIRVFIIYVIADVHGDAHIRTYPPDGGGGGGEPPPGGGGGDALSADYDLLTLDIPRQQILIGARYVQHKKGVFSSVTSLSLLVLPHPELENLFRIIQLSACG